MITFLPDLNTIPHGAHGYYNNEPNQMYPSQYYQNDYSNNIPNGGGGGNMAPNSVPIDNSYYEGTPSSKHPAIGGAASHPHQYYDQNYYDQLGPPQQMPVTTGATSFNENCDTYGGGFQQAAYVANTGDVSHLQAHPQMTSGYFGGFEGVAPNVNVAAASGGHQQFDGSNSSSDFNFLSNIANDFSQAPEYYQLS